VTGVLPGTLVATRLGLEGRFLGLYGVFGAGTFTTYRHIMPRRAAEPIGVMTGSTPFGFFGFGAELHLYGAIALAGEVNWGGLFARNPDNQIMAPAPTETISTAVAALRIAY
jgi:hypothetical protein